MKRPRRQRVAMTDEDLRAELLPIILAEVNGYLTQGGRGENETSWAKRRIADLKKVYPKGSVRP